MDQFKISLLCESFGASQKYPPLLQMQPTPRCHKIEARLLPLFRLQTNQWLQILEQFLSSMNNLCCQHLNNSWFPSLEHCGQESSVFSVTASLSPYYKATNQWCQLRNLPCWPKDIARYTKYADSLHIVGLPSSGWARLSSIGIIIITITGKFPVGTYLLVGMRAHSNSPPRTQAADMLWSGDQLVEPPFSVFSLPSCYAHQDPKQERWYSLSTWMWRLPKMSIS